MKKNASAIPVVLGLLALAALVGGVLLGNKRTPPAASPPPITIASPHAPDNAPAIMPSPPPPPTSGTLHTATIFQVVSNNDGSHLEPATVTLPVTTAETPSQQALRTLNAMAHGKDSPLPDGTEARSVTINGDTATVDFNAAFKANFHGGDESEALALNSVLATMGQFAGVHRVQITVGGKTIDSLGGTQSLSHSLPVPQQTAAREVAP